jgi:hypothetical protein
MRDPFGLDAFNLDSLLDGLQFGLDVIGLVPGFGEVADGINGLISLGRGDYVGAGLSFGAMVPVAGWGATAGKFGRRAANAAGAMGGAGKAGGRAGDAGRGAGRGGGRNGAGDNGAGRNGPGLEPSECFPAGTPITMADGSTRPIEAVREGDLVLSADEKTGKQSVQRVTRTFVREAEELYVVCTQDGASIEATGEHPFWVEDKGFVEARRLARSDLLRRVDGRTVSVERVTIRRGEFTVYNLEVAKTHTYYAGKVWVHNQTCPDRFPASPAEMDDILGFEGRRMPDVNPQTGQPLPGRGRVDWDITVPGGRMRITYEAHPYHPNAPDYHRLPHWHVDWPGRPPGPHPRYSPGDPFPGS